MNASFKRALEELGITGPLAATIIDEAAKCFGANRASIVYHEAAAWADAFDWSAPPAGRKWMTVTDAAVMAGFSHADRSQLTALGMALDAKGSAIRKSNGKSLRHIPPLKSN